MDICPPDKLTFPIAVIGAGAVGSATVLTLAKMGCPNLTVWDHDRLTEHNVPNQMCRPDAVGLSKAEALRDLAAELTGIEVRIVERRYQGQALHGVVISAVDNMSARKTIWERVKLNANVPLLIDPRMGAELARIYAIRPCSPDGIELYDQNLYDSSEAEQLPCSARAIIYCPTVTAGLVASVVKAHAVGESYKNEMVFDLCAMVFLAR